MGTAAMTALPSAPTEWRDGVLNDVIESIRGGFSVQCGERPAAHGELGVLKTGAVLAGQLDLTQQKFVPVSQHDRLRTPLRAGTIVLCRKNSEDVIGASAFVETDHPSLFLSDLLWEIKPKPDIEPRWLFCILQSSAIRQAIRNRATGTQHSMKNISHDKLLSIPIKIPLRYTQQCIAEILTTWDKAVVASGAAQIRAICLYLGTAAKIIRLRGTRMRPLGELIAPDQMEKVAADGPFRALGVRSHGKGTFQRIDDLVILGSDKTLYRIESGRFIVNIVFAWEGAVAITSVEDAGCFVSHRFPTFTIREQALSADYFSHVIRTDDFRQLLALASPGGAGRNKTLNRQDLLRFEVHVPPLSEQRRFAEILSTLDCQAAKLERYAHCLAVQRQALAAELLTGRLRVPEAERLAAVAG